jgi:hypothetical protein
MVILGPCGALGYNSPVLFSDINAVVQVDPWAIVRPFFSFWGILGLLSVGVLYVLKLWVESWGSGAPRRAAAPTGQRECPGVYMIRFPDSGCVYIGATFHGGSRLDEHWSKWCEGTHFNPGLSAELHRSGQNFEYQFRSLPGATAEDLQRAEREEISRCVSTLGRRKVLNKQLQPELIRRWRR